MSDLKLWEVYNGETDWVAANDEAEARRVYMHEYELHERDMEGVAISLVADPDAVKVYTDEVNAETEEAVTKTASEVMAEMKWPGIVCSTVQ
jgi:hypothetical protein